MTRTTKQVLIVVGILALLCVVGVVVLGGIVFYVTTDKDSARDYDAKKVEGHEFGKTTDKRGCMQEGLARAKKLDIFSLSANASNQIFVLECLHLSRRVPDFCDGVPSSTVSAFSDWPKKQCKNTGMDEVHTGCPAVFNAQVDFCNESFTPNL